MKTPLDVVRGRIVDYDPASGEMTIKANYSDWFTASKREYKTCLVQMVDSRPLSDKQRRACYALLREISDYTGMGLDQTKEYMKLKYLAEDLQETADKIFSLSHAPMSLVCGFQKFLARVIIDYDIPASIPISKYVDDVQDYVYACAVKKKCCVCGKEAEAHHWKRIGAGANRETMNHLGWPIEPLCREHHEECHTMAQSEFDAKWHIEPIKVDRSVAKVFGLHVERSKS